VTSLKGRLTASLAATLIAVFGLQWWLINFSIRHVTEGYILARLDRDIDSLFATVDVDPSGNPQIGSGSLSLAYETPYSGHYFLIRTQRGTLSSRSLWDEELRPVPWVSPGNAKRYYLTGPQDQPLLGRVRGFRQGDRLVNVVAAQDLSDLNRDLSDLRVRFLALTLAMLWLLVFLQRYGITWALRPVEQVRSELGRVTQGKSERIAGPVPAEVRPLTEEINRLVDMLSRRLQLTRSAVGNLAHALKTPLTVITQLASDTSATDPQTSAQVLAQTDNMRRLIERELKRARLAGSGKTAAYFQASTEIPLLIKALDHIYADKEPRIEVILPPQANFPVDREDMLELIGNLADNACKWAKDRVRITIASKNGLSIEVEDDGPGCSPEQLQQLGSRGLRLDESTQGHGLGLAIAREIIHQYQGRMEFLSGQGLGGLCVRVNIPI
jgi:signal transduction histidine kinase